MMETKTHISTRELDKRNSKPSEIDIFYLMLNGYTKEQLDEMNAEEVAYLSDMISRLDPNLLGC